MHKHAVDNKVWRWVNQRSYSTSSPVSTKTGDPFRYVGITSR